MRVIFLAITLLVGTLGYAQQKGKVLQADGQPVEGAFVRVLNTNLGTVTDANGSFSLELGVGRYDILITAIGYAALNKAITVSASGNEELSITLAESAIRLDDVVVTAEKEEGELQRVPYSISALSSRKVSEYRIWNSKDITAIVPNLYSANPGDNRNVTSIRGITSTSYDPAIATYIDGVNQFSLDTYIAQLFDVERIEVLRGPQGTLYGRNAMGGVINIITRQPSNQTSGVVEASIGNYGQQRYSIGVRTPLVKNKLFLGVAGMYDRTNGFYTNTYTNGSFDKGHSFTGNYYLTYAINPRWSLTLNAKHHARRNNGAFPLAYDGEAPYTVNQNATTQVVDNVFNSSFKINHTGSSLNFSALTTYQSNYRYYKDPIDGDFSPIDGVTVINNYGRDWNNVKVVTQEFKLSSPSASLSPFKWTAGTYLFYQDNPVKQSTHFGADAAFVDENAVPFSYIQNTTTGKNKGIAFFGQATYSVSEQLDVTAGLRYDYERKELKVHGDFYMDGVPDPVFETQKDTSATTSYKAFSPKVSVTYHLNAAHHLYATYSRGFRTGGLTQLSADPSQPPMYEFKPEHSNNFEAGIKNTFLDNRLQLNVAAFYIKVDDAQVPTLVLPQAITITRNAGELTSKGAELEISAVPVNGLQVDYNLGFTDATYTTLTLSGENKKGNRQIFTPKVTSMLALQYSYALGTAGLKLVARGEWMYLGEQYFDLGNNIKQSPYGLLNARAGISSNSFEVMFWARNLGDKQYIAYAYDFGALHYGDPRNWGVTLRKNF